MSPSELNARFEAHLSECYREAEGPLHEAIRYALLGPGKRLRPRLAYLAARCTAGAQVGSVWERVLPAMLAVEMVHCYSLVHDDLPAMDNDDFRRGRLSCHKKYGEAVGILVGDALIADAFATLSRASMNASLQMRALAKAIGSRGMVLGQDLDLRANGRQADLDSWLQIHALKTGRLFEAACLMGALSVDASDEAIAALSEFARAFGVAFQLKDDLSDNAEMVQLFGKERVLEMLNHYQMQAERIAKQGHWDALLELAS